MKSLSKGLMFMNLLFGFASIIQDGETAALNNSHFNQKDVYQEVSFPELQNPNLRVGGLRISDRSFASIIQDGETAALNNSHFNQEDVYQDNYYPELQNPNLQVGSLRISDRKCMEYIHEVKYKKSIDHTGSGVSDVLSYTVIGGRDAYPGEFPHMGALGWKTHCNRWKFMCGSTLISDKFSLTAAHCSQMPLDSSISEAKPEIVRLNTNVIDESSDDFYPVDAHILRIIVHPEYTSPMQYYDIALIEFKYSITFTKNLHPACLWNRLDTSILGSKVISTGWGSVDPVKMVTSSMLQAIEIKTIDSKKCYDLLIPLCNRLMCKLREHQLCAGTLTRGIGSCNGYSGGPLQVRTPRHISNGVTMHYLIGVTSFGFGCGGQNLPGVYTRVSSFIDWIECNVWNN